MLNTLDTSHIDQCRSSISSTISPLSSTTTYQPSLIKWPGGKRAELKFIHAYLPEYFVNYYEPFVGGGSCFLNIDAQRYYINDRSDDLMKIYDIIKSSDNGLFFSTLALFDKIWREMGCIVQQQTMAWQSRANNEAFITTLVQSVLGLAAIQNCSFIITPHLEHELHKRLAEKFARLDALATKTPISLNDRLDNMEAAVKSAFYNHMRYLLNTQKTELASLVYAAVYYFIRDMAYSGMFRYTKNGHFNVPYGGISYNKKRFATKIDYLNSTAIQNKLSQSTLNCDDFLVFLQRQAITHKDFVFLDPPYDSTFSAYAQNAFTHDDHKRLADYLQQDCPGQWMLIIKKTDFIHALYSSPAISMISFDKKYQVSFQNRNDKNCTHLIIRNYGYSH